MILKDLPVKLQKRIRANSKVYYYTYYQSGDDLGKVLDNLHNAEYSNMLDQTDEGSSFLRSFIAKRKRKRILKLIKEVKKYKKGSEWN